MSTLTIGAVTTGAILCEQCGAFFGISLDWLLTVVGCLDPGPAAHIGDYGVILVLAKMAERWHHPTLATQSYGIAQVLIIHLIDKPRQTDGYTGPAFPLKAVAAAAVFCVQGFPPVNIRVFRVRQWRREQQQ